MFRSSKIMLRVIACLALILGVLSVKVTAQSSKQTSKTLDPAAVKAYASDPILDLNFNLIRLMPSLLDEDQSFLRSFILLNNCNNPAIENQLNNEFDGPQIVKFYREHAAQIVAEAPSIITYPVYYARLGEYDSSGGGFPILGNGQGVMQPGGGMVPAPDGLSLDHYDFPSFAVVRQCGRVFQGHMMNQRSSTYRVAFENITMDKIAMDEASARRYVESLADSRSRPVVVLFEIEISQGVPKIVPDPHGSGTVSFLGHVKKIMVATKYPDGQIIQTVDPKSVTEAPRPQVGLNAPQPVENGSSSASAAASTQKHSASDVRVFQQYSASCDAGDAKACAMVGYCYVHGSGVDKNPQKAKEFYEKSCSMGRQQSCLEVRFIKLQ